MRKASKTVHACWDMYRVQHVTLFSIWIYMYIYTFQKFLFFFFISKLTLCHNDFHSSEERQKMRRECKHEWHYRSDFTINEYDYLFAKTRELDVWEYSIRITSGIGLFICWTCYRGHSHRCRSVFAVHVLCIADYVIIHYTPAIDYQCIRCSFGVQSHEWHANTQQQRYDWCHHVLRLDYNLLQMTVLTHWGRYKMAAISQTTLSSAFSWKNFD